MTDFSKDNPEKDIEQVVQQFVDAQLRAGSGLGAVDRIQDKRFVAHVFVCGDASLGYAVLSIAFVSRRPRFWFAAGQLVGQGAG